MAFGVSANVPIYAYSLLRYGKNAMLRFALSNIVQTQWRNTIAFISMDGHVC
jgi:hypothetical protein